MMASRVSSLVTPHLTKWLGVPLNVLLPGWSPVKLVNDFHKEALTKRNAEVDDRTTGFHTFDVQRWRTGNRDL
jgi:hypothetical protein